MTDHTLVVADDLTGAMDTGHGFAARGFETVVRVGSDAPDAAVSVVDTDSRYKPPYEAAARVCDAIAGSEAAMVFKKVDSTLRGNLVSEIDAAVDAADADAAAIVPAFPSNGRTTACGYHFVDGELITDTAVGNDPDAPVTFDEVPALLRDQGAADVIHVPANRLNVGDVSAALNGSTTFVSFDAIHDSHLKTVATTAVRIDANVVIVGCGGLAKYVPVPATPTDRSLLAAAGSPDRVFGVVGSVAAETLAQLDALPAARIVNLDAAHAVSDDEEAAHEAAAACRDRFDDEAIVVLASARERGDVSDVAAAADDVGVSDRVARERVLTALADAAVAVCASADPGGLFLTGGAVAKQVLGELDARSVELLGEEVAMGVPVGVVRGGLADAVPVVTKAGTFGDRDTIAASLEYLFGFPRDDGSSSNL